MVSVDDRKLRIDDFLGRRASEPVRARGEDAAESGWSGARGHWRFIPDDAWRLAAYSSPLKELLRLAIELMVEIRVKTRIYQGKCGWRQPRRPSILPQSLPSATYRIELRPCEDRYSPRRRAYWISGSWRHLAFLWRLRDR